jgi:hypothetical protein
MTDERLDRLVRQLLTERADDVATVAMPAQTMAAVVASHVRRGRVADRRLMLLAAAVLLVALAAGAAVVGSGLVRRVPEPAPTPLPVVVPSLDAEAPTPAPSDAVGVVGRVFYTDYNVMRVGDPGCTEANANRARSCTSSRIWIANQDGSNARELFPEATDQRTLIDVSGAGDAILYMGPTVIKSQTLAATHLAELGPDGEILRSRVVSDLVLDDGCVGVCAEDTSFTFSPDGTRLAYVRGSYQGDEDFATVIVVEDVATGEVDELESTRASGPAGYDEAPAWSPDGTQLLFTRDSIGVATPDHRILDSAIFVVNADGSYLRQLSDTALFARDGAWSPDGSLIAFTSAVAWLGVDEYSGKRENLMEDSDVYTIRPGGSDLRRLTNFTPMREDHGVPVQQGGRVEGWTRNGRIVFSHIRWDEASGDSTNLPPELWTMNPDGENASRHDGTNLAGLAAVGCADCPYPPEPGLGFKAFWRPEP